MRKGNYMTKQKSAILNYLISTRGQHITVQQIAEHFAAQGTPIGVATIYRHLDAFVQERRVKKYVLDGNASACFQYDPTDAPPERCFHFRCQACGKLLHFQNPVLTRFSEAVKATDDLEIDLEQTVFYGTCKNCSH